MIGVGEAGYRLAELAERVNGELEGDGNITITGVGDLDSAEPGEIVFVDGPRLLPVGESSNASAIIVPRDVRSQRVLDETARCLRPGGAFLLETRNREHQIVYAPYYLEVTLADGSPAVMRCHYDRERHALCSIWSRPDDPEAIIHRAAIRLYGLDELSEMFRRAALAIDAIWGDYDGTEFQGFERMLIILAHKPD